MSSTAALSADKPDQRKGFLSLRLKLIIAFTLVVTLVFGGAFYWFYLYASDVALTRVRTDLETTLASALKGIDGDEFEQMAAKITPEKAKAAKEAKFPYPTREEDPLYWKHVDWLLSVHNIEPRAFLYTYISVGGDPNHLVFIGSHGAPLNPVEGAPPLLPFDVLAGKENVAGLTAPAFVGEPYTDQYGTWISAFTPIKNSSGKIVGVLGTDYLAEYVLQVRDSVLRTIIPVFVIAYLIVLTLTLVVANAVTGPTVRLTSAAEKIADGDYDQDLSDLTKTRYPDEIAVLADVFNTMVGKVYQREQSLKAQVQELKILVDSSKRDAQVAEIVETDFFTDLQTKAAKLRNLQSGSKK